MAEKAILRVTLFCIASAAFGLISGCTANKVSATPNTAVKAQSNSENPDGLSLDPSCKGVPQQPVLLGIAQDKTGSVQSDPTPQLKAENLALLYGLLRCSGGELAFGVITGDANKNLVRLRVEERPQLPSLPDNPNPFMQQEEISKYKKEHGNKLPEWEKETQNAITKFGEEIQPLLDMPASSRRTDFFGTLQELDLFTRERRPSWDARARRFLLVISDAQDNVYKKIPSFPAGTQFLLVYGGEIPDSVNGMRPIRFENLESAVRYIVSIEEQ